MLKDREFQCELSMGNVSSQIRVSLYQDALVSASEQMRYRRMSAGCVGLQDLNIPLGFSSENCDIQPTSHSRIS